MSFDREDLMVEIRVAIANPADARGLMRRLASLYDRAPVSFDRMRSGNRVRSERERRAVVQVIDVVEELGLLADDIASAELSVGERSYTLASPASPATRGRAA